MLVRRSTSLATAVATSVAVCAGLGHAQTGRAPTWGSARDPEQQDVRQPRERGVPRQGDGAPRRSVVYAQAEAGYETLTLHTLRAVDQFPTEVESGASGTVYGVGAGVRLGFLTLGARYRTSRLGGLDLNSFNGEVGARLTRGQFEPYLLVGAGYARMTSHGQTLANTADVSISGPNGRAGVGIDFFPDPRVSLGANVMGEFLTLARPGFSATQNPQTQAEDRLMTCAEAASAAAQRSCALRLLNDAEGSSYAVGATVSLVMGLHF